MRDHGWGGSYFFFDRAKLEREHKERKERELREQLTKEAKDLYTSSLGWR